MKLNSLPKTTARSAKRPGRGLGSGKGKTGGRGQKGQKARGKVPAAQVGGGLILYKKLPFKRGWGNRKVSEKAIPVKLSSLNILKPQTVVNIETIVNNNIVTKNDANKYGVKILNDGKLDVALKFELPVSESARVIIEKAGGQVTK